MSKIAKKFIISVSLFQAFAGMANAGTLIVSGGPGDLIFATTLTTPNLGNQTYARNLLGDGSNVSIFDRSTNLNPYPSAIYNFYAPLPGVSVNYVSAGFDAASVIDTNLLIISSPYDLLGAVEEAAIRSVLNHGGTVYMSAIPDGLAAGLPGNASTQTLNSLLFSIGSGLHVLDNFYNYAAGTATGAAITANVYTQGVTSFSYGLSATVAGGTAVFLDPQGAVVSFESNDGTLLPPPPPPPSVPEPANWALMIVGLGAVGAALRRRPLVTA